MAIRSLGAALDQALQLPEPPAFGLFAGVARRQLDPGRLIWLAAELWLALAPEDRAALIDADRRTAVETLGEPILERLNLDLLLLDEKERRAALVAFWRGLPARDRAAFLQATTPKNGRPPQ